MRVLVVTRDFPTPANGEGGIVVIRQIHALRDEGHEVAVAHVVPHAPPWTAKWRGYRDVPQRYAIEGIPVETIRALLGPRLLGMEYVAPQVRGALERTIARFRPDLLHAHYVIPSGHVAVRSKLPVVVTAHGSDAYDWPWRRAGLRRAATQAVVRASVVTAVSEFVANRARALGRRDVDVVYNGADERVFDPAGKARARASLDIAPDRFTVAFTGRVSREKGAYDLLDAAARLPGMRPLLLLAGADRTNGEFAKAAAALGVEARCMGMLDQYELATALRASDAFCLPSYREGLPLALCEAMLCGLPAIATPVGGIPEILRAGERGFLVRCGDVEGLAERLKLLAANPDRARALGDNARRFALSSLTWRINARRYGELYRRAVDTGSPYSKTKAACIA